MEATLVEYGLILKDLVRSTYENNMATEIPSDGTTDGTTETNDVIR
jgi:hypothetical protein